MSEPAPTTRRGDALCVKLGNFFMYLLTLDGVKRNSKAVEAIKTNSSMILRLDPKTGLMCGYAEARRYIDTWIMPAFERVETKKDHWEMKLREGLKAGDETTKSIKWYDWLIDNNVKYWEIKPEELKKEEIEKIFRYLNCFVVLTAPFNSAEAKKQEEMAKFQPPEIKRTKTE